ncbi:MAG: acetate/propionate family kinase [Opitutales bacterium]
MKVLVANMGSTSFKYQLFELGETEQLLAKGGYERVEDFEPVIGDALQRLQDEGFLSGLDDLDAVGFKCILAKDLTGCVEADDAMLEAMEAMREVAPAHNPAYAAGIRLFRKLTPGAVLVALFETAFYQWVPEPATRYAVPDAWHAIGIRRNSFHGASHKFIAERTAEICGRDDVAEAARGLYQQGPQAIAGEPLRVVSCHLGGSSSLAGIRNGVALGASMGLSPQSGLPHNNRVGDLDSMAIPLAMKTLGLSLEEAERQLTKEGGLFGLSGGLSNDLRDIKQAAAQGNARAQLAIDVLLHQVRHWTGAFMLQMGGLDCLAFTGGIGEHNPDLRAAVCEGLEDLGFRLDPARNEACVGDEAILSAEGSPVTICVIPANEERVIAREVRRFLAARQPSGVSTF